MILEQKIEKLDKYCKGSLAFTHYTVGWDIHSYKDKTLFEVKGKLYKEKRGYLSAKTFKGIVDLAYKEMLKDRR